MRRGPATRAALFVDVPLAFSLPEAAKRSSRNRIPGGTLVSRYALKTSHVCTGDTFVEEENVRNRKVISDCAQTVEDRSSLWKVAEKPPRFTTESQRHRKNYPTNSSTTEVSC